MGFVPTEDEQQIWEEAERTDRRFARVGAVYEDPELEQYLNGVARNLLEASGAGDVKVRVRVLRDPFLNAFALPNGSIYLHTGILARMENEAQLATVLAHELTHFRRRHSLLEARHAEARRSATRAVADVLAVAFAGLAGNVNAAVLFLDLTDPLVEKVIRLQVDGYSRERETEADRDGFEAIVAAGYDPREAPAVFRHLQVEQQDEEVAEPYVFGSHPKLAERIASYNEQMEDCPSRGSAHGSRVGSQDFAEHVTTVRLVNARLDMEVRRFGRARDSIERHLAYDPNSAEGYYLLGQIHQRQGDGNEHLTAAAAAYRAALERDPAHAPAHRDLGSVYWRLGELTPARDVYRQYLSIFPKCADRHIIESYLRELSTRGDPE